MAFQRCSRCIMDNATDTTISFDRNGYCNYCSDVLKRAPTEYFPNEDGKQKLDEIILKIKEECKDDPYDCIVGVSGGIDSSYILYLGYLYNLRMLAVHVDDGLDNPVATENIRKLTEKTGTTLITISPNRAEYSDLLKSLFQASVPNLAIAQDNLIICALEKYGESNGIRYSLDGSNFAHESILERSGKGVNNCDAKYIMAIQKQFGALPLEHLEFATLTGRYLKRRVSSVSHVRPLNFIDYSLEDAIKKLQDFCDFEYYGGKHYESILTRFLQCYYLPQKFGIDKRKSHFSSLIVSGQMSREEALKKMEMPLYLSEELLEEDKRFLASYMNISVVELEEYILRPPKFERDYPHSCLNSIAPMARKLRKLLE